MSNIVNVAVAVIHFQEHYLLGYRHASQHQGDRYEFIGGKIEAFETPQQGLIREVHEEIGLDICQNLIVKMGVIRHDYPEKSVALHIFKIAVSQQQFKALQTKQGQEGQHITWVKKADLLAEKYRLPDANALILQWLTLADTIFISQSLDAFANADEWVNFYTKTLPQNAHFYVRPQSSSENAISMINELRQQRNDISYLIQYQTFLQLDSDWEKMLVHLNHQQLMTVNVATLPNTFQYFVSCHDQPSLKKANELAQSHTLMGCFLSPVLPTPTHPSQRSLGWQAFAALAAISDVPVFALGGISQADLSSAWQHQAFGIAGIRLIHTNH